MKAIILAAGKGSRLTTLRDDLPKCLAPLGGISLIERQIRALRSEGIEDIVAVVGFGAELVKETCGPRIEYVENRLYRETNSLFSLLLARRFLQGGFVVLNADVVFHPQLLSDLLTAQHEDALLISYPEQMTPPFGDEEMKVRVKAGRITDISKQISARKADGENVGIAKFGASGAALVGKKIEELIRRGAHREWAPRAFKEFALERPLHAIGTRGYPWIEIDFPEDYHLAVNAVLPKIIGNRAITSSQSLAESAVA